MTCFVKETVKEAQSDLPSQMITQKATVLAIAGLNGKITF